MTKHYFGIASIIFASACLIWSIGQATAFPQGPNVGVGTVPYESFTGTIHYNDGNVVLLTVPSDRVFIVTTCMSNNGYFDIKENGTTRVYKDTSFCSSSYATSFTTGNASLVISSNSTLEVGTDSSSTIYYYIEGYYAQP